MGSEPGRSNSRTVNGVVATVNVLREAAGAPPAAAVVPFSMAGGEAAPGGDAGLEAA
jgi:hypothetical protein